MNLLLDTHIALWAISSDARLGQAAAALIGDHENSVLVSAVTILEIAIKRSRKADALAISADEARRAFEASGYSLLPVTPEHAAAVEQLPQIHGDPFDRLLVAQALTEPLRLVTRDRNVARYSDTIILV